MDSKAEYSVIVSSTVDIIKHIGDLKDPKAIADELFAAQMLSPVQYQKILGESDSKQIARDINMAVMLQVDNSDIFKKFIDILRQKDLKDLAEMLEQRLRKSLSNIPHKIVLTRQLNNIEHYPIL